MNKFDYLGLDGHTLRTFITVLEETSVSKAALRLGVSQSAVSHTLDRLRLAFDDALFIRDGRGIMPTAKALSLREPVESIINNLKSLTEQQDFNPLVSTPKFNIATNDFPMLLIFPDLIKKLQAEGIKPRFHFSPAGVPSTNLSRASHCQLVITPAPPKAKDIIQKQLFMSKMVCFYDANVRQPPKSLKQYIASDYAEVRFSDAESSIMVLPAIDTSALKEPAITVPNFSTLKAFIKGSKLITTQLELMNRGPLKGLDSAPLPMKTQPLAVYMAWHKRDDNLPAHQWLRQKIVETINMIFTETEST